MSSPIDRAMVQAVLDVADGLDLETTLQRILTAAVDLTGATYGALGVVREDGSGLQRFFQQGMPEDAAARIGHAPVGKGVLGEIVRHPGPLRLEHVSQHPAATGFPRGHPVMDSFLGLPIRAGGTVYGNIYLTDKPGGFDSDDEDRLVTLAAAAGVAISNAKLFASVRVGEQWQMGLAAIANAALQGEDGGTVLQLLAEHSRDVTGCDAALVLTPDEDGFMVEVVDTDVESPDVDPGMVLAVEQWLAGDEARAGQVTRSLRTGEPVIDHRVDVPVAGDSLTFDRVGAFPIQNEDATLGVLVLLWRHPRAPTGADRIGAVAAMAAQAGVSLRLEAARRSEQRLLVFRDRDRIARDLHDLVVQRLFASGVSLQVLQRQQGLPDAAVHRVNELAEEVHATIAQIRGTIFDLREGFSGHWQIADRLQDEVDRMSEPLGFTPELDVDADVTPLDAEDLMADTVAVVREGLSNTARHAQATAGAVRVTSGDGWYSVFVEDNGTGPAGDERKSGLANLEQRAVRRGGTCALAARDGTGCLLVWSVPLLAPPPGVDALD